jgi:hypothetical protein
MGGWGGAIHLPLNRLRLSLSSSSAAANSASDSATAPDASHIPVNSRSVAAAPRAGVAGGFAEQDAMTSHGSIQRGRMHEAR